MARSHARRNGRRCTFYAAVPGGIARAAHAGSDKIVFDGVLDGGVRLSPGSWRLALTATAAGGSTTAAARPNFTLLGP